MMNVEKGLITLTAGDTSQSVTNNSVFEYYSNSLSWILFDRIVLSYFIETNTIWYSVFRFFYVWIVFGIFEYFGLIIQILFYELFIKYKWNLST